jgi:hypothetical protein
MAASGISPPPPPSYPAAWASLPDGGFTAIRRLALSADVPEGLTIEQLYPDGYLIEARHADGGAINPNERMVWFETASGKIGAANVSGTAIFFSSDQASFPLAGLTHMLITPQNELADEAVQFRIAITDAPPPPPPPSYPAAWASLGTNGITAVRQGGAVLVRQSFGTPLNSAWQTVWFETPGGKVQAAANGDGLFASPDESMLPIAGFSHILISNAGANENNQIEWRVAITNA